MGDRPALEGGSGEVPHAAGSDLASPGCEGVRCGKLVAGDDVMPFIFCAGSDGTSPGAGAGANVDVFVGGEGGRCGCFDGEGTPLPLPASGERASVEAVDLESTPIVPLPSPMALLADRS